MKVATLASLLSAAALAGWGVNSLTSESDLVFSYRKQHHNEDRLKPLAHVLNQKTGGGWKVVPYSLTLERQVTDGKLTHEEQLSYNDGYATYSISTGSDKKTRGETLVKQGDKKVLPVITLFEKEDRKVIETLMRLEEQHASSSPRTENKPYKSIDMKAANAQLAVPMTGYTSFNKNIYSTIPADGSVPVRYEHDVDAGTWVAKSGARYESARIFPDGKLRFLSSGEDSYSDKEIGTNGQIPAITGNVDLRTYIQVVGQTMLDQMKPEPPLVQYPGFFVDKYRKFGL